MKETELLNYRASGYFDTIGTEDPGLENLYEDVIEAAKPAFEKLIDDLIALPEDASEKQRRALFRECVERLNDVEDHPELDNAIETDEREFFCEKLDEIGMLVDLPPGEELSGGRQW